MGKCVAIVLINPVIIHSMEKCWEQLEGMELDTNCCLSSWVVISFTSCFVTFQHIVLAEKKRMSFLMIYNKPFADSSS